MSDDVKEKIFIGLGVLWIIGFFVMMIIIG